MKNKDLLTLRNEYSHIGISLETLPENPFDLFSIWFDQTLNSDLSEANGMVIATMGTDGQPSQRTVLMKSFDHNGLYFYTNYHSRKAKELEQNPKICCLFPWLALHRQVEFQGTVHKVNRENSAQYFATRPRSSQIGAWASRQSEELVGRKHLEERVHRIEKRFRDEKIPLPDFWGGYCVVPNRIEFWQGRSSRLHDRFVYTRDGPDNTEWRLIQLYP